MKPVLFDSKASAPTGLLPIMIGKRKSLYPPDWPADKLPHELRPAPLENRILQTPEKPAQEVTSAQETFVSAPVTEETPMSGIAFEPNAVAETPKASAKVMRTKKSTKAE